MNVQFEKDPFPGRPRILFVGMSESSHTHSWIGLLDDAKINVRMFAVPPGAPPQEWDVKTYVTAEWLPAKLDSYNRSSLYPLDGAQRLARRRGFRRMLAHRIRDLEGQWLAKIIKTWRPDIIHTLGLESAGYFYHRIREKFGLAGIGKWVLQLRGGSDLALTRFDPESLSKAMVVLRECDQLLTDNQQNFEFVTSQGVRRDQLSRIAPVPGTGGVDVDSLAAKWQGQPSSRRIILWTKSSEEGPWHKALPVLEALKLCWDAIQPCRIRILAASEQTLMWFRSLPECIKAACEIYNRIPRSQVLNFMTEARVMLAPSLVDGTPNSLFEAMAAGAFPVVSPLETIVPLVQQERNVLFARNLYPHEIAEALSRAMRNDVLVDTAAANNLEAVRNLADRARIRPRVVEYYESLAAGTSAYESN